MRQSEVFLLFLTRGVLSRPFVQLEIATALLARKPILLVHSLIENVWYVDDEMVPRPTKASVRLLPPLLAPPPSPIPSRTRAPHFGLPWARAAQRRSGACLAARRQRLRAAAFLGTAMPMVFVAQAAAALPVLLALPQRPLARRAPALRMPRLHRALRRARLMRAVVRHTQLGEIFKEGPEEFRFLSMVCVAVSAIDYKQAAERRVVSRPSSPRVAFAPCSFALSSIRRFGWACESRVACAPVRSKGAHRCPAGFSASGLCCRLVL